MTGPHDTPDLDDVIDPTESAPKDRREHGKSPDRVDDDYLEYRTEQERIAAGARTTTRPRPTRNRVAAALQTDSRRTIGRSREMERGSDKHGPKKDDALTEETEG